MNWSEADKLIREFADAIKAELDVVRTVAVGVSVEDYSLLADESTVFRIRLSKPQLEYGGYVKISSSYSGPIFMIKSKTGLFAKSKIDYRGEVDIQDKNQKLIERLLKSLRNFEWAVVETKFSKDLLFKSKNVKEALTELRLIREVHLNLLSTK